MHIYPALLLGRGAKRPKIFLEMFFQKQGKTVFRQLDQSALCRSLVCSLDYILSVEYRRD
jgi:hypothetical protein